MIHRKTVISCLFSLLCLMASAYTTENDEPKDELAQQERSILEGWKAGETVSLRSVERFGSRRCFESVGINDTIFRRIYKKSFKEGCTVQIDDLRYVKVLHYNIDKEIRLGELICHKSISDDLVDIFKALYDQKYPIERMVLIDEYDADDERSMRDNNSSSFNFRFIPGTAKLSNHGMGRAIDINPRYNPYVKEANGKIICRPDNAKEYIDRSGDFPYKIDHDDLCFKEFAKRGFTWGGDWNRIKDYQHFEKTE